MTSLVGQNLSVVRGGARLVDEATLGFETGELVVLLGPNGAGKTTLLRALIGLERADGAAQLKDRDVRGLSPKERARHVSSGPGRGPRSRRLRPARPAARSG